MYKPPSANNLSLPHVYLCVDGACSGNPGPGGWAALLRYNDQEKILSGGERLTTNNRMELIAAINGLAAIPYEAQVDLVTDSQYVHLGITKWVPQWQRNNWRTSEQQDVKNRDLWELLLAVSSRHRLSWQWVRGHNGHRGNELVDKLARKALQKFKTKV